MDEPKSDDSRADCSTGQDRPLAWTRILGKQSSERKYKYLHEEGRENQADRFEDIKSRGIGWDRVVELILAGAITLFAAAQWITSCANNYSTSGQVNKIIIATNQIGTAASRFSDSADRINNGIGDAVNRLGDQANNMGKVAGAGSKANQLSEDALEANMGNERPYLEIQDLTRIPYSEGGSILVIGPKQTRFQFRILNTGPGRAINIRYQLSRPHRIRWDAGNRSGIIEAQIAKGEQLGKDPMRDSIPEILGHDKSEPIRISTDNIVLAAYMTRLEDDGEYFFGQLDYDDLIGFGHKWQNTFCIMVGTSNRVEILDKCHIKQETIHLRTDDRENRKKHR
ncbi:MAG TPA: hypothetical protein VGN01_09030 [Acidobacteriaceae bacterium]|jgi:hypothetical protein